MDDEAAMVAVRDHDDAGLFAELVTRWQDRICMYCFHITRNWQASEDISQDVFLRVYEKRRSYAPSAAFSTFIWKITTNLCNDFFRRQKTEKKASEELEKEIQSTSDPSELMELTETRSIVTRAIAGLSPKLREVLVLKHYQQLKIKEIAQVLDLPMGTVASRLADALNRLEREMAKLNPATHSD